MREDQIYTVWDAIALHTTPGVTQYMKPEVGLIYSGVGLDVLGRGLEQFPADLREKIVARYPRRNFKQEFPGLTSPASHTSPKQLMAL